MCLISFLSLCILSCCCCNCVWRDFILEVDWFCRVLRSLLWWVIFCVVRLRLRCNSLSLCVEMMFFGMFVCSWSWCLFDFVFVRVRRIVFCLRDRFCCCFLSVFLEELWLVIFWRSCFLSLVVLKLSICLLILIFLFFLIRFVRWNFCILLLSVGGLMLVFDWVKSLLEILMLSVFSVGFGFWMCGLLE